MLGCHNHVDIVAALDAVVVAGEEAVGVWRQIESHHVGFLVGHMVQEAWILMGKAVVVLLPYIGCKYVGERRYLLPPRQLVTDLEPLGVLREH